MDRKRVLVVDDEPEIADVLRAYLVREGLSVETCGTAADALALLGREPPDLLVLDVTLPDGSGLDVLRAACASRQPYSDVDVDRTFRRGRPRCRAGTRSRRLR